MLDGILLLKNIGKVMAHTFKDCLRTSGMSTAALIRVFDLLYDMHIPGPHTTTTGRLCFLT